MSLSPDAQKPLATRIGERGFVLGRRLRLRKMSSAAAGKNDAGLVRLPGRAVGEGEEGRLVLLKLFPLKPFPAT